MIYAGFWRRESITERPTSLDRTIHLFWAIPDLYLRTEEHSHDDGNSNHPRPTHCHRATSSRANASTS